MSSPTYNRMGLNYSDYRRPEPALPLEDKSVDAAMGILTIHHWPDLEAGLAEMRRVARRRIVLLTLDAEAASGAWLIDDYFPEAGSMDRDVMPSRARIRACLPSAELEPVAVPRGCLDGFTIALWDRPEWLLDPEVRRASSIWHRMPPAAAERGLERLRAELENGRWDEKYGRLRAQAELDIGLRLVRAEL
jgi:SAM-dependent methyltransferase